MSELPSGDSELEMEERQTPDTDPRGLFLSVDVDSLNLYLSLYGKEPSKRRDELTEQTYKLGVERFLEMFAQLGVKGTFFMVGKDLENEGAAQVARRVVEEGHRCGNHTWSHPYNLIRLSEDAVRTELIRGHEVLKATCCQTPTIFRAPGYNMTSREYRLLSELGYQYDSSPLPSYAYLLVKYAIKAGVALIGRRSRSIWGNPLVFMSSRTPYRRGGVIVLPIAVTSFLRLPVIGTALSTAPRLVLNHMISQASELPFVGIEFHAVDLMELEADHLPASLKSQKDLLIPLSLKRERFKRVISELCETHELFLP